MNKKAKLRIFNKVISSKRQDLKNNHLYRNRLKKLILLLTKGKKSEQDIIKLLCYPSKSSKITRNTKEQYFGLLCGNPG